MESLIVAAGVPFWYAVLIFFVLGVIIGSFVQVFVYRFNTGSSINTPSHCLSCRRRLRWFELFPVFSYLLLRGRCRTCAARIPIQDFLVETGFGLVIVSLLWYATSWVQFGYLVVVLGILLAISLYDLRHYIIPDILLVALALVFILQSIVAQWSLEKIALHALSVIGSFSFFFFLWSVSDGRWVGFGDAKLAAVLSIPLTPFFAFSMLVFSFWAGTLIMLTLLGIQYLYWAYTTRRVDKKHKSFTIEHKVPFAPFLILSFSIVYVYHYNIADVIVYVL